MLATNDRTRRAIDRRAKPLILIGAVVVYASNWWPTVQVRTAGMELLGLTDYETWGIFVPHLLFYTTVMAALAALFWLAMARQRWLPYPPFGNFRRSIAPGLVAGVIALILSLATVLAFFPAGSVHWIDPNPWKIAGNVFSNFYEEFIWRGFLLFALREVIGFWPAAVLSSASWALFHTQYPLVGQLLIFVVGIGFSRLVQITNSLWAPYIAHEVLDILGDSLIG